MIGEFDRRISLYNFTETRTGSGEPTRTWTLLKTCWAKIEASTGSEIIAAKAPTATAELFFTIRYCSGITEKTRVLYNSVNYNITHIEEIGRKDFLKLAASKPDNQ